MSAFEVSDKHVSAILQGVYGTDYRGFNIWRYLDDKEPTQEQFSLLSKAKQEANVLMSENVRSVRYCYKHHGDRSNEPLLVGQVQLDLKAEPLPVLQVLKLIDCLEYQSCECPDWKSTEAYKLLCDYRSKLIRKLPGYNDAKWSI